MRTYVALCAITVTMFVGEGLSAQQPSAGPATRPAPARAAVAHRSTASSPAAFKPVATIKDLMGTLIDPASKVVFEAVGSEVVNGVETQKQPRNDQEWTVVRRNALMLAEGANLMMIPGRHAARPGLSPGTGELPHEKIEALVNSDRQAWNKYATEFMTAAQTVLAAADARDPDALFASGADLDMGCENCHLKFWYPDQDKLFTK